MKFLKIIAVLFLGIIINIGVFAERKNNIDVYLVIDKSLSMQEKINTVKEYINQSVISDMLIPGDSLTVITFYGKAEDAISYEKVDKTNKQSLEQKISNISGTGKFTDIGNALDELKSILSKEGASDREKYILLITDGKQEAPPTSKYYSPGGKFNHEFLKTVEETKEMQGWKIMILGIGKKSITKELSKEFSGNYTETSDNPTKEELAQKTENFFSNISLQGDIKINAVPKNGNTKVILKVLNKDSQPRSITIDDLRLSVGVQSQDKLIDKRFIIVAEPNKEVKAEIPVKLNMNLKPGINSGELSFTFFGDAGFTPSSKKVNFYVYGFFGNNIWIVLLGMILILAIAALIVYLIYVRLNTRTFKIIAAGVTLNKNTFSLQHGKHLFITDSKTGFEISNNRVNAFARILAHKHGVSLYALDSKRIQGADKIPGNVLNVTINMKKADGDLVSLKFE